MAGMWSYRARDAVATAMHGMWGSFWLGYGLLWLLVATGQLAPGTTMDQALAFWFIALAAITISGTLAALVEGKRAVTAVLATLAVGASLLSAWAGRGPAAHAAGWLFVVSAGLAWYTATAMMLAGAAGRTVVPLFSLSAAANVPGRQPVEPIQLPWAEPGIKHGQ
jgi:uncharacterized protein